jgi:two-component system nitrate/nitrite response regulator NarL
VHTVAICDTEPVAIEGLRTLLAAAEGLRVVAAENSLQAGMDAVRELNPTVVVLDKAFGVQLILEAVRSLRHTESEVRSVVWGSAVSDAEALRLLHGGAMGVVRKTAPLDTLLECVSQVAAGYTWTEDSLIRVEPHLRSARSPLTAREVQVMELVERGFTNKDIGMDLGIRTGTVKIHLKHIFEKTGIRGRYGLALSGLKEKGLLLAPALM